MNITPEAYEGNAEEVLQQIDDDGHEATAFMIYGVLSAMLSPVSPGNVAVLYSSDEFLDALRNKRIRVTRSANAEIEILGDEQ